MSQSISLTQTLLNINPRYLAHLELEEFQNPEYDPRNNPPENIYNKSKRLSKEGIKHTVILLNWFGDQLTDFKNNFLQGDNRPNYVARKAQEVHQVLEEVESLEERLRRENIPIIKEVLNTELAQKGVGRLLKSGHDLTDLAEKCALEVLHAVRKFDVGKIVGDYFSFVRSTVRYTLEKVEPDYFISWNDFKERCLDQPNYEARAKYLMPLLSDIPIPQLMVLTKRYGLDCTDPLTAKEIGKLYSKPVSEVKRLERLALTKLGIRIDATGFHDMYYSKIGFVELRRRNKALWKHARDNKLLNMRRFFGRNPYAYYLKHHKGLSRGSLKKKDPSLYYCLWKRKQLTLIPLSPSRRNYNGNPHSYYLEHYDGLSRGRLGNVDRALYVSLIRHDQLHLVPTLR